MLQCWRRAGHLPSFFVPTTGNLTALESPSPGICPPRQKKANARGSGGGKGGRGWAQLEFTGFCFGDLMIMTCYWVYLSSDHPFQIYYKVRQLILLQSATIITKCDRTTWEFLEFGISRHPDQWRGYWRPTWLSGVFYHFDRKGIHYQTAIEDRSSTLTNYLN